MGRNSTSHQFDTFIGAASATVIAVAVAVPSTVIKRRKKFYSTQSVDWSHFRAITGHLKTQYDWTNQPNITLLNDFFSTSKWQIGQKRNSILLSASFHNPGKTDNYSKYFVEISLSG